MALGQVDDTQSEYSFGAVFPFDFLSLYETTWKGGRKSAYRSQDIDFALVTDLFSRFSMTR